MLWSRGLGSPLPAAAEPGLPSHHVSSLCLGLPGMSLAWLRCLRGGRWCWWARCPFPLSITPLAWCSSSSLTWLKGWSS